MKNYLILVIFIYSITIVINDQEFIKYLDLDYTHSLCLQNGNLFIIHKNGVLVYNYNFTIVLYSYDFSGTSIIPTEKDNNFTSIIQCQDNNNKYVIALINENIYIFSSRGQYLFSVSNDNLFSDFSTSVLFQYYSFLYYKYEGSIYYFIVTFLNTENSIKINEFAINIGTHSYEIVKQITYKQDSIISDSVSCEITYFNEISNVLGCFYVIKYLNNYVYYSYFQLSLFDIEENFQMFNETIILASDRTVQKNFIIKTKMGNEREVIIIFDSPELKKLNYFAFDFDSFTTNSINSLFQCNNLTNLINLYYLDYINQFVLTCKYDEGIRLATISDFSISSYTNPQYNSIAYETCDSFINYDLIFLPFAGKHYVISNFICSNTFSQVYKFPDSLEINLNNYVFPSDEIDSNTFYTTTETYNQVYTTIPTTIPTTILTTIPTTILTTIPTKTMTTIPTTTLTIIPNEIETTIPTKIVATIPTKIVTTIPTKIITTIPTKIVTPITTFPDIPTTIITPISTFPDIPTTIITQIITIPVIYTTILNLIETTVPKIPSTIITPLENNNPTTIILVETTIPKAIITETTLPKIPTTIIKEIENIIPSTIVKNVETTIPKTIINGIVTTIPTTSLIISPTTTYPIINNEINCKLKCLTCNEDSFRLNLCIKCNQDKKYYPSIKQGEIYVECYNEETKPTNYYLNKETYYYEPCYSKCKTCDYPGNEDINNCTSCKRNYIFQPELINSSNCVKECKFYYYINYEQYFCTQNNQCPTQHSLLIKDKKKCIDKCFNDNEYIYQFNYECLKECPEDTILDENFCKIKNKNKCYLYSDHLTNIIFNELKINNFDILIQKYINGFNDTDFHVDFYQSNNFTITIYKTIECLKELEMVSTIIDFGECYEKVQEEYNFIGRNLIILIADFFNDKILENTLFYFFNPENGEILSIEEVCLNKTFKIEKSLTYYSEINIEQAKFFEQQNIDIFNSNDVFYTDLCHFFESPNGRDVPLKERLLLFYPNVTLCDDTCKVIGVNLTSMKAICECKLKELLDETEDATKLVGLDFGNIIESVSLDVVKCYKTLFQLKYIIKCYGGFISIILILAQSICVIIVSNISMYKIRRTTFNLLAIYTIFLRNKINNNFPPKKNKHSSKNLKLLNNSSIINDSKSKGNLLGFKSPRKSQKNLLKISKKNMITFNIKNKSNKKYTKSNDIKNNKKLNNSSINNEINLKEYLMTSLEELEFDELIDKEKRSFIQMFLDRLKVSQMIVYLFYNKNWIIPKSIKLIFIIVMIDLYFVVNALFYNEAYITNLYYLDKKENFFTFVPRSLNRIIYTSVASSVLDFIISLLFPTENKIKKILIKKKKNITEMKNKVFVSMKNIINNYWIFIIISYFLTIFSWYYISCFNNVYP